MTVQSTPAVVHPDRVPARPVPRDVPVDEFVALMEATGASPDLLSSLRRDW
jgi:hypothetical protein